jgi:hypothetical protein
MVSRIEFATAHKIAATLTYRNAVEAVDVQLALKGSELGLPKVTG